MKSTLVIPEQVTAIAVENHSPTVLTPEFLNYSGIVKSEWKLARQPICTSSGSSVTYTNGVSIVAEPQRIMFACALTEQATTEVKGPEIARKYVQALPQVKYLAVGNNFRGYATFDDQKDAARKYISETLLSKGSWQEVGTQPMRATLNLAYTLERGVFYLSVNEAILQQPDETTNPVVLFSGNFSYDIAASDETQKLASLHMAIDNWQKDLDTYKDIITSKFLSQTNEPAVVVPDIFAMSAKAPV